MSILAELKVKFPTIETFNYNDKKFRSTKFGVNPFIPAPENRPRCSIEGCDRPKAIISTLQDGSPSYRKICAYHHDKHICKKNGVKYWDQLTARRKGMTVTEYTNQYHPYLRHRLDYCENKDGRLGYVCNAPIPWKGMLQVDHIDGNPHNNAIENLQTLCANCHTYKTHINQDTRTPGRKSAKYETFALRGLA